MIKYGYLQNFIGYSIDFERRKNLLLQQGVCSDNLFIDSITVTCDMKQFECPELQRLLLNITQNSKEKILYVSNITDLGRYSKEIMFNLQKLFASNTELVVFNSCIDTTENSSRESVKMMLVSIFRQLTDNERSILTMKQKEGVRMSPKHNGRPSFQPTDEFYELCIDWQEGKITREEILKRFSITKSTLYKYKKENLSKINRCRIFQ